MPLSGRPSAPYDHTMQELRSLIPPRRRCAFSPSGRRRFRRATLVGLALLLAERSPALGQVTGDTVRVPARAAQGIAPRQTPDSLRPPLSPARAFLYSFLVPGLGQARLDRHMAGTLYFGVEALSLAMLAKASNDLRVAKAQQEYAVVGGYQLDANGVPIRDPNGAFVPADSVRSRYSTERVRARQTHVEDWIAILIFNHLFAGVDALVSSLLWDVPVRVGIRAPGSGAALAVSVRW